MFRSPSSDVRRPPVLVLQIGWRTGPIAIRSLVRAGFAVVGGHEISRLRGRTRYCPTRVSYPPPALDPNGFLDAVQTLCERHEVRAVLPLDDDVVDLLARSPWQSKATVVGPTASQFDALCDKWRLAETAQQAGLDVPQRAHVGRDGRVGSWPPLPSLVKPRATSLDSAHLARRKPTLVRTAAERDRTVRDLVRCGVDAIVEEKVRGRAWRVHFVRAAGAIALLTLRSERAFPVHTGQSSLQVVALEGAPPNLIGGAVRLLDVADYHGPGSIQAFERDGRIVIHDVNLRLPITVAVTVRAGLDMPRLAVEAALGEPLRMPARLAPATYVGLDEIRQLLACLRRQNDGLPARRVAADLWRGISRRDAILDQVDLKDPVPTLLALRELAVNLRRDWSDGG